MENQKNNPIINDFKTIINKFFYSQYLNPLECKSEFLFCDPVIIYLGITILISMFMLIYYIFHPNKKINVLRYIILALIIDGTLLVLINLCKNKKPTYYSSVLIIVSLILSFCIL